MAVFGCVESPPGGLTDSMVVAFGLRADGGNGPSFVVGCSSTGALWCEEAGSWVEAFPACSGGSEMVGEGSPGGAGVALERSQWGVQTRLGWGAVEV